MDASRRRNRHAAAHNILRLLPLGKATNTQGSNSSDGLTGERVLGHELLARAVGVALGLRKMLGYAGGAVVAAALDNGPQASCAMIGVFFAANIFAPVNPDLHQDDLRHAMSVISPRVVFCAPRALAAVRSALSGTVCEVLETAEGATDWEEMVHGRTFLEPAVRRFRPVREPPVGDDTALVMASSGTTGPPKGVAYSHQTLHRIVTIRETLYQWRQIAEVPWAKASDVYRESTQKKISSASIDRYQLEGEVTLVANPFAWISGLIPTLGSAASGWVLVYFTSFDVEAVLRALLDYRVTAVTLSSPHISAIAAHPKAQLYDASTVTLFRFGGSPLSPSIRERAEEKIKKKLIFHYGLTECPWPVTVGPLSANKPDTVGMVAPLTKIKVIDYQTGLAVGPDTEGEICIQSSLMFSGYFRDQKATAEVVDEDGWLHTGDVGRYDRDGYLFIVDRFKELIKHKGFHISPGDIERVLMRHEAVADAGVVGVEHDDDQERPVAFVALRRGPDIFVCEQELTKMLQDALPQYKQLYGGLYFGTHIPRTQGGKIKRRELRQLARVLKPKNLPTKDEQTSVSRNSSLLLKRTGSVL